MTEAEDAGNFLYDKNFISFLCCICYFFIYFAHDMDSVARITAEKSAGVPFSEQVDHQLALTSPGHGEVCGNNALEIAKKVLENLEVSEILLNTHTHTHTPRAYYTEKTLFSTI